MRRLIIAALGLALAGCETVPLATAGFAEEPDIWIRWTAEGFHGDTIATFHNGTDRDACIKERGSYSGWRIPPRTTVRRPFYRPAWDEIELTFVPAEVARCTTIRERD